MEVGIDMKASSKKLTIEVNGKKYEIKKVGMPDWREFFKFDGEKKDLLTYEFLDKHCEIIAMFFDGITANDLIDNLEIGDVLKIYNDILDYLMELLTSKLGLDEEKNVQTGAGRTV